MGDQRQELDDLLHMGNHITNTKKLESYKDRLTELEEAQEGFRILWVGLKQDPLDVDINDVLSSEAPFDRIERTTQTILQTTI